MDAVAVHAVFLTPEEGAVEHGFQGLFHDVLVELAAPLGTLSGPYHLRKRVADGRGLWYTESYQKGEILIELLSNS